MSGLLQNVIARSREGRPTAIPSVCSAHPEVLEAALRLALRLGRPLVIEAPSDQIDPEGGPAGQTPADFAALVQRLVGKVGLDRSQVVLGADGLGPRPWRHLPAPEAMAKADATVRACARAGFSKLHLDCSEGCAGEPAQLPADEAASRAAALARVAAETVPPDRLLFAVDAGTGEPGPAPTTPQAARAALDAHAEAFRDIGRIGALATRPGAGFAAMEVHHLPLDRDPGLKEAVAHRDGVVLEARCTDYQRPAAFPRLAELGFAFQKTGPALTFAWREGIYALDALAQIAGWTDRDLSEAMERAMLADPRHWQRHLDPGWGELRVQRHFSYADRIRFYWPKPEAQAAVERLRAALSGKRLPDPLLRQGFSTAILDRAEPLRAQLPAPDALLQASVQEALAPHFLPDA